MCLACTSESSNRLLVSVMGVPLMGVNVSRAMWEICRVARKGRVDRKMYSVLHESEIQIPVVL